MLLHFVAVSMIFESELVADYAKTIQLLFPNQTSAFPVVQFNLHLLKKEEYKVCRVGKKM